MGEGSHEGLGWLTLLIQNVPDHRTGVSEMEILRDFCAEPNGVSVTASSQLAQIMCLCIVYPQWGGGLNHRVALIASRLVGDRGLR